MVDSQDNYHVDGKRSVVLIDDLYEWSKKAESLLMEQVVRSLSKAGFQVIPRDVLADIGSWIVPSTEQLAERFRDRYAKPSAWIIDIELSKGARLPPNICDGIGLARHIRKERNIQRRNDNDELTEIPIIFLSRFHLLQDVHPKPDDRDPNMRLPLAQRVQDEVGTRWRYFHKNVVETEAKPSQPLMFEEFLDPDRPPQGFTGEEFAEAVREMADGTDE